jgi:UDPglucose 6-dehydrogenase
MNVGMVGLGKLGLPVAYAMASQGLDVYGYDPVVTGPPEDCSHEEGLAELVEFAGHRLHFASLQEVVRACDVIFVAVQTPHDPRFEGVTPLPEERADFDYRYLKQAIVQVEGAAFHMNRHRDITVVVISTVLPGTMQRDIVPLLHGIPLVYNPSFIAMGTTISDFLDPEFVLIGGDVEGKVAGVYEAAEIAWRPRMYEDTSREVATQAAQHLHSVIRETSIQNAELIKVAYNTFIGLKIAFANTLMEVCHKTNCDVDEVTGALKLAHRRLISPAYMDGGMGDGGGCHPRDNIALSWLARELDLSYDLFGAAMEAREAQAEWLCDILESYDMPIGIVGLEYKPRSLIKTGSPAVLVKNLLEARGHEVAVPPCEDLPPRVWLIGCKHPHTPGLKLPPGSVVIDPFRYMPDQDGVRVVRLGEWEPDRTATSTITSRRAAA